MSTKGINVNKLINDKFLLNFKFPPDSLPFQFKKAPKRYRHSVCVLSNEQDVAYVMEFNNEKDAKEFKRSALKSKNNVTVWYEKKELKVMDEGYII